MLANDIAVGVMSVFEKRDCDYSDGLPERIVEFTEDESLLNMSALATEVIQILNENNATLLDVSNDSFTISFNSVELKCKMIIFNDTENDGVNNIKEFSISEVSPPPSSPASPTLNEY